MTSDSLEGKPVMVHYNSRVSEGVVVAEGPEPYEVTVSTARYGEITVHRDNVRLQEPEDGGDA